jgi:DNA-binding NarL/FixJ family response regulator
MRPPGGRRARQGNFPFFLTPSGPADTLCGNQRPGTGPASPRCRGEGVTRVRLFSSHPLASAKFRALLSVLAECTLVDEEDDWFDVGVFDAELPSLQATLTLARLKYPAVRPVLVSAPCGEDDQLRWLFRGLWGVVSYDRLDSELCLAVQRVAEGNLWFPPTVIARWMQVDAQRIDPAFHLTAREKEVMELLLRRLANKEIASILKITERTVKFHVGNILGKLNMNSRHELSERWINDWEPNKSGAVPGCSG